MFHRFVVVALNELRSCERELTKDDTVGVSTLLEHQKSLIPLSSAWGIRGTLMAWECSTGLLWRAETYHSTVVLTNSEVRVAKCCACGAILEDACSTALKALFVHGRPSSHDVSSFCTFNCQVQTGRRAGELKLVSALPSISRLRLCAYQASSS